MLRGSARNRSLRIYAEAKTDADAQKAFEVGRALPSVFGRIANTHLDQMHLNLAITFPSLYSLPRRGADENSPAFQRREPNQSQPSPKGRLKIDLFQPSLWDFDFPTIPGVETPGYSRVVPPGQT